MRIVKKPEERRAEMVAAASKLFARQGFVRTSVAEIVSAVDVAKGLFYYYFTTKDDMVKAVVEGYCGYLETVANEIADGEGTAREKLARLMHHKSLESCFTEPMVADLCLPQHAALYMDMCDRIYAHIGPAVERIVAQGLAERGKDEAYAKRITGVGLYGSRMTARRGGLNTASAGDMADRLLSVAD